MELHPSRIPVWRHGVALWRMLRRWFSRREWTVRLLRLWTSPVSGDDPGLVMIQIDGLSRTQLEVALQKRRMPYLRQLMQREGYALHTLYSGQPATTPAVQAELFYGVKTAVPAFSFRDAETGEIVRMIEPACALRRQERLASKSDGLLKGGSAYSNIYSGGAAEAHFCPAVMGWGNMLENAGLPRSLLVLLLNVMLLVRTAVLFVVELLLAITDAVRGLVQGRSLWQELKLVPSRVAVGVLLRELIAIGTEVDTTRGLPVIHLNLLGYDEQAHRRGPRSAFAHWSLRQIDRSIQRICEAAFHSSRRDYQVWIYSDHGQEPTCPYWSLTGKTLRQVVFEVYGASCSDRAQQSSAASGIETHRAQWLGGGILQRLLPRLGMEQLLIDGDLPAIADQGSVAHLYWPDEHFEAQRDQIANRLVRQEQIPLVCAVDEGGGTVAAWNSQGQFQLPRDNREVFGAEHPFLEEVTRDWMDLCRHPEAGDFVICGWSRDGQSVGLVTGNGADAGPGLEETRAFALLPREAPIPVTGRDFIRPLQLRDAAMQALGRDTDGRSPELQTTSSRVESIRLMTYNVHSCLGLDRRLAARRRARVIMQSRPDIVALQELDVGRSRTGDVDQVQQIAQALEMEFHFHPALKVEKEQYGNAILSRFPMSRVCTDVLPGGPGKSEREPRGAIQVAVDVDGLELQVINTHLGLSRQERLEQIRALLGPEWLANEDCTDPAILCGDFNAGPTSAVYRQIVQQMNDVQRMNSEDRPRNTWSSTWPVRRIDHVFSRGNVSVDAVEVPRNGLARVASDHLPLLVELRVTSDEANTREAQPSEAITSKRTTGRAVTCDSG